MSFEEFAYTCHLISTTSSKNEKVKILADYIKGLDDQALKIASIFLSGRIFPKGSELDLNLGYKNIWDVIISISNISKDVLEKEYLKYGDLGKVAELAVKDLKIKPLFSIKLELEYIYNIFRKMASLKGSGSIEEKKKMLEGLLINSSPLEARYLVKIMLNELRIGLTEGLVEQAVAVAFGQMLDKVRRGILLSSDIGSVAIAARYAKLDEIKMQVLRPVSFMLADTIHDISDIKDKMIVEYKYDGIRAQLHKSDKVKIFSRRLEDITYSFPELVNEAMGYNHEFILDGEILAYKDKPLHFNELQKRLRSKNVNSNIPIKYIVYDILYLDQDILIDKSLIERKKILHSLEFKEYFMHAQYIITDSKDEIIAKFDESKRLGHEGLMLKDPYSNYQVGNRNKYWLKLKQELDTLDVVIVAAEYGHGKRARLLSDYTFAVRDGDKLKIIGKAYSGLTDEEIMEMTERLKRLMIKDEGYRIIVKPEIVLEVAFDDITRSDRYDSSFALRFPRIKRIRYDKSVDDIDNIDKVRTLYNSKR
ncbi:MAG: DNA ligase [Candidatus Nitrosocaldaceae archaeon]|nr:MAG: DNA ligase [Candidatus Nitrosocaldaceae archaeon]GIU72708.1 MAG: DNA ligase [Candidatus Nitrosocaldaceae archaeon]